MQAAVSGGKSPSRVPFILLPTMAPFRSQDTFPAKKKETFLLYWKMVLVHIARILRVLLRLLHNGSTPKAPN
jgi:hypothetical protein